MNEGIIVAFDTSNYTTSLAVLSRDGELIANLKRPLAVKAGERGLRQSDALFAHTVNLPEIMKEASEYIKDKKVVAVGVSEKPRNEEGSYMPCFLAGISAARAFSVGAGAPLFGFSHQCGHIMAAVYSSRAHALLGESFAAFHISGGTTELVKVEPLDFGFKTELIGGTLDLNAGQIIDRVGVYMGLAFPSGAELERLALTNTKKIPKFKISSNGMCVNLSGLENLAKKLYDETADKPLVGAFVFEYIASAVIYMSEAYENIYGKTHFVYAGGVMCNSIIKEKLSGKFTAIFAEPSMSADNAVGVAALALRRYNLQKDS